MKVNVGTADRVVRIVVGLVILSLLFILAGPNRWWGLVGLVPLLTGIASRCPAYSLLGLSTCPIAERGKPGTSEPAKARP